MKVICCCFTCLLLLLAHFLPASVALQDSGCQDSARLFPVSVRDKWGFVDRHGELVVAPEYKSIEPFAGGVGVASGFDRRVRVIDMSGRVVAERAGDEVRSFGEGVAGVRLDNKWGFMDRQGKLVIEPRFDDVAPFSNGMAAVREGDSWGYIDHSGNMVVRMHAKGQDKGYAFSFHEGLALSYSDSGKLGYINKQGDWAIDPSFDDALDFHEQLAAVKTREGWGYIKPNGTFGIAPLYAAASSFHHGVAAVGVRESLALPPKIGFLNPLGSLVIRPRFDDAGDFCEGLAAVKNGASWGYIDAKGAERIGFRFKLASGFSDGLAAVVARDSRGRYHSSYIDKEGRTVWVSPEVFHSVD